MSIETETDRYVRIDEVKKRAGLSHTAIYNRIKKGTFPASRQIGGGRVRWLESELAAWLRDPAGWGADA